MATLIKDGADNLVGHGLCVMHMEFRGRGDAVGGAKGFSRHIDGGHGG